MPDLKTYDLFISHAWCHNEDYQRLEEMLLEAGLFKWRNYSVSKENPLIKTETHSDKKELLQQLDKQIKPVNAVLILGGMYVAYSEWIQHEIKIAQSYSKPIIGIYPWGHEKMPQAVSNAAIELVGWNTNSIVTAIRKNAL